MPLPMPTLVHTGTCLLALATALVAQPEATPKPLSRPPKLDKLAAQTLKKWETLRYHLEGAGVNTLSFDLAVTSKGGMTGTWTATGHYSFGGDLKHPYGVLTWKDEEIASAMRRRGWTAEALARDVRKDSPVMALANASVTARAARRGTILVVTGGKTKDEQFLLYDRAGVHAGEMVGPMQKRIHYEQTAGKYLRIGESYKMPDTAGELKITYTRVRGVLVPSRLTEQVHIRGKLLSDLSFVLHKHRINGKTAKAAAPTSRPSAAAGKPRPQSATGSAAALALASLVETHAGGRAALARLRNLGFTFNSGRRLLWDRQTDRIRIENLTDPPTRLGHQTQVMVRDLGAKQDLLTVPQPPPGAPRVSGYSTWINDSYWLLVTLKVLDPGVRLSIDPPADTDATGVARLRLQFAAGTGITAGNQYVLHVDKATGRVHAWDYYRDARSEPRRWKFANYTEVGGLRLSLRRQGLDGSKDVVLGQVTIDQELPADIWSRKDRYLRDQLKRR